jgi:hypothetical protein
MTLLGMVAHAASARLAQTARPADAAWALFADVFSFY